LQSARGIRNPDLAYIYFRCGKPANLSFTPDLKILEINELRAARPRLSFSQFRAWTSKTPKFQSTRSMSNYQKDSYHHQYHREMTLRSSPRIRTPTTHRSRKHYSTIPISRAFSESTKPVVVQS
jgi:hypothetical protein